MKTLLILAIATAACTPPYQWQNDSAYPDKLFLEAWSGTENLANANISLDGFDIHVFEAEGAFHNVCLDVDGLGCTDGVTKLFILGALGTSFPEVAEAVAHQLGHIYYQQRENNLDGAHLHEEWFGEGGIAEMVRRYVEAYGL